MEGQWAGDHGFRQTAEFVVERAGQQNARQDRHELADYRAGQSDDAQIVLMVVSLEVADMALGRPGEPAAGLVDLLGSSDARERYAATSALESAHRRLVHPAGRGRPLS